MGVCVCKSERELERERVIAIAIESKVTTLRAVRQKKSTCASFRSSLFPTLFLYLYLTLYLYFSISILLYLSLSLFPSFTLSLSLSLSLSFALYLSLSLVIRLSLSLFLSLSRSLSLSIFICLSLSPRQLHGWPPPPLSPSQAAKYALLLRRPLFSWLTESDDEIGCLNGALRVLALSLSSFLT
jgi:hypothetical protein